MPCRTTTTLLILGLLASLLPVGNPAPSNEEAEDWPMYRGGPQHLGARGENGPGTGEILWKHKTPRISGGGTPAVWEDLVFFADDGDLLALNQSTGEVVWNGSTPGFASPVVSNGTLFTPRLGQAGVVALDARTGQEIWETPLPSPPKQSVAVSQGTVVVSDFRGGVHALDATNGSELWESRVADTKLTPPTVRDGIVYVGVDSPSSGGLHALALNNGSLLWSKERLYAVRGAPAVAQNSVYIFTSGQQGYAFDADTGEKRWNVSLDGVGSSIPVVSGTTLYVAGFPGDLYALDTMNGETLWRVPIQAARAVPAVSNGTLYTAAAEGEVLALSATDGSEIWRTKVASFIRDSTAVVADGRVFVGTDHFWLYALDASPGKAPTPTPVEDGLPENDTGPSPDNQAPALTPSGLIAWGLLAVLIGALLFLIRKQPR